MVREVLEAGGQARGTYGVGALVVQQLGEEVLELLPGAEVGAHMHGHPEPERPALAAVVQVQLLVELRHPQAEQPRDREPPGNGYQHAVPAVFQVDGVPADPGLRERGLQDLVDLPAHQRLLVVAVLPGTPGVHADHQLVARLTGIQRVVLHPTPPALLRLPSP
ncbi:hypothetical protein SCYAM73S_02144 [Streptomyces cyaneofuscatus]|uniref:hypothetical protein n=1 Tax=Streptomyces cyaneofuscatus TaxID=66883 RepID=UPI0004C55CE0|nr:hypothetical protein [Streptomyces cyaneofuscatus]